MFTAGMRGAFVALAIWLAGAATAGAESRLALVIGNSAYQTVPALPNPVNDAKAMGEYLKSAGFEVTTVQDATQGDMRLAIGSFADAVSGKGPEAIALVYYAGHGLQVDGENYLVPVDASILREADVPFQAIRLADLMNSLASVSSKARIVMLDACRNNPFSEINKVTGKGLAIVDAPPNSIISYSTSPGSEALDGEGANSPYTTAVLAMTKEPGLAVEQAFERVRFAVNDATKRQQLPWESSSLTADFAFFPGDSAFALASGASDPKPQATPVSIRPGATPAAGRVSSRSVDAWKRDLQRRKPTEAYEIVTREDTVEAYQAYLSLFPAQVMSSRVREVLDRRRVMIAWYAATTIDTVASYEAFLAAYADTDLAPTARRLLERAKNRMQLASTSSICPCALSPGGRPIQQQQKQKPEQKATRSIDKKHAKKEKKKEKVAKRGRKPPKDEDESAPAQPVQQAAPIVPIGIGIGFGGFGGGRGMGGGGGGYRPQGGPMGGYHGR